MHQRRQELPNAQVHQNRGISKEWLEPGLANPALSLFSPALPQTSGGPEYGVCFSNSPDLLPFHPYGGAKNEVCYRVSPNKMCCHINKASY